jgi:hypothetical protein
MDIDARLGDSPAQDGPDIDAPIDSSIDAMPCAMVAGTRARWRAEQNTADQTATFNGSTIGSNFGYTAGKHGSAFLFDGVDDGVTIDDADMLWPTASFTLEAWVKTTSTAAGTVLTKYACGNNCPAGFSFSYFGLSVGANGIPQFDFRPEVNISITSLKDTLGPVNNGAWHHLVGVRDNAMSKAILYVDGAEKVTSNLDAMQLMAMSDGDVNADFTSIGTAQTAGLTTFESYFNGAIDDVAIYTRALTAAEVAAIYNAPDGVCP